MTNVVLFHVIFFLIHFFCCVQSFDNAKITKSKFDSVIRSGSGCSEADVEYIGGDLLPVEVQFQVSMHENILKRIRFQVGFVGKQPVMRSIFKMYEGILK